MNDTQETMHPLGSSLYRRLAKGLGAQGFGQAVQVFIRVAEVPLLLGFWGSQLYGEWLMLSAIPTYLSISDGGFATAACREMTMRSGAGDRRGALAVFQSTWLLLIAVSIAAGLLVFGFVEMAPLEGWLGFSALKGLEIKIVLLLLVTHILVGFQGGLLNGGFWVAGKYPRGMTLQALTQLLEFGGLAAAVALSGGPVQAASGYLVGRIVGTGLMWIGQRRACPWLRYGFANASFSELRQLAGPALASLSFPLGNALNIQGIRLVVGFALGPPAVALFTPLRTLSRLAMQPRAIINRLIQPELGFAHGAKNFGLFRRLFARSCQLALWGCLAALLAVGVGAHWIFPAWTDGNLPMDWPTYTLLLAGVLVNSIWYTALMIPYATNRHGRIAIWYALIYGGSAFGLAYLGAISAGLAGAALTLLLVETVMAAIVLRASLRMAQMGLGHWARLVSRPPFDILSQFATILRRRIAAALS